VRYAVVGHIEWVEFARVPKLPHPGTIVHATETWAEPAGGGSVIARQVTLLADECVFFTALGDDEVGHASAARLRELGLTLEIQDAGRPSRRAWTHVDGSGERTITLLSEKLLPRGPLPLDDFDAVFFVSGDAAALHSARLVPFVAATTREQPTLREAGEPIDLLVGSLNDPGETLEPGVDAGTIVLTDGAHGGVANGDRYAAAEPPGPIIDSYGAGDSFAAALFVALARGDSLEDGIDLATHAGAAVITGRGPYSAQLTWAAWQDASRGSR
jgi:ribokinase